MVDSKLQPDPGDETAALLRVLIYKIDSTTFGGDVPALPQWNGPPPALVHVQAILFASLAASLLSALLAMLGKQWLNRYDSSDMRGSSIERSHNRQRKLDGIVTWYFTHVMESLPLMLQGALFLLGFALSIYLWEVSIVVASVVLGVTSLGVLFYIFIIVAGVASESCPYQTPGSLTLRYLGQKAPGTVRYLGRKVPDTIRHLGQKVPGTIRYLGQKVPGTIHYLGQTVPGTIRSIGRKVTGAIGQAFRNLLESRVVTIIIGYRSTRWHCCSIMWLGCSVLIIPLAFTIDLFYLGWAVVREVVTLPTRAYHLVRKVHRVGSTLEQRFGQHDAVLDLRCVSWTLQTSLDRDIRQLIFEYLSTRTEIIYFDPTFFADISFNVFIGCISMSGRKMATMQGKEQLATASVTCLLHSLNRLSVTDPASSVLIGISQRYNRSFPLNLDCRGLPFYYPIIKIHSMLTRLRHHRNIQWDDYEPSNQELVAFAQHMVEAAQLEYQETLYQKVPRWILRFALHFLSLDPPPPVSVVADCLTIVAIDLSCQIPGTTGLEQRYVPILQVFAFLTRTQVHEWSISPA